MFDKLTDEILQFRDERDWKQFHSPKNLAVSMAIEAAELMELFQWTRDADEERKVVMERAEPLRDEIADVLIYALLLCHEAGVEPGAAIRAKVEKNRASYPAERAKGSAKKYTEL